MSDSVIVQFVGFEAQALVREYKFIVRRALDETSEFTLTIGCRSEVERKVPEREWV